MTRRPVVQRTRPSTAAPARRSAEVRVSTFNVNRDDANTSRQIDIVDTFMGFVVSGNGSILLPTPYNTSRLFDLISQSNMLRQCIDAYVTNTVLTGWEVAPLFRDKEGDDGEIHELQSFIDHANTEESLATVMEKVIRDRESVGYGFCEVIRDRSGSIAVLRHAMSLFTRLTNKHDQLVLVKKEISRGRRVVYLNEYRKFRKYIQMYGIRQIWFKEFGDPRRMDSTNGQFEGEEGYKPGQDATEIIHWKLPSNDSYGVPRWINQIPNILGSRESEEVNMRYFQDNTVPPMMLLVGNGRLTAPSFNELNKALNQEGVGRQRQNRVLLLEAVGEGDSLDGKSSAIELKVEKLTDTRQSDGLFKEYDQGNMAKIRSVWRLPPMLVGMSQDVNFACYDQETETLTDKGWVSLDQYKDGMRVASVNPWSGRVEFSLPINGIQVYEVENVLMHSIQSTSQNMLVTPQHRMVYRSTYKGADWSVEPIETMLQHSRLQFLTSVLVKGGEEQESFEVPHLKYRGGIAAKDMPIPEVAMDLLLEWVGYYLGDGCIIQKGNAVSIGAKKERKIALFERLHDDMAVYGFRTRRCTNAAGTYFALSHKGLVTWLDSVAGQKSRGKRVPEFIYSLSRRQIQIVFDAVMACDGTTDRRPGHTSRAYYSVSKQLADGVQILATLLGYRATVIDTVMGSFSAKDDGAHGYRVLMSKSEIAEVTKEKHFSRVRYSGRVYCFTVPTGVFITRRKGKVAIQGNTGSTSVFVAESQVFAPERSQNDERLNNNFVNGAAGLALKTVMLVSRTPSITSPEMVVKTMTALNVMGAVTPRQAQKIANKMLQIELKEYPAVGEADYEEWMDQPLVITAGDQKADALQAQKDAAIKETEADGQVEPTPPKHGNE